MLTRYTCHKQVDAAKIKNITSERRPGGRVYATFEDGSTYDLTAAYVMKHKPEVDGYFVRYDDGYESFSPAKAFENGYTRLV